jgi:hypothetical protein
LSQIVRARTMKARDFSDTVRTLRIMPGLTVKGIEAHKPAARPYKISVDRGLQMRIAPDGTRTLLVRYTVRGANTERQYRLPRAYGDGLGQIRLAEARAEAVRIRALARAGLDWPQLHGHELVGEGGAADTQEAAPEPGGPTLAEALNEYVERKRRSEDGLALKARTRADYLFMIRPGRKTADARKLDDGILLPLANRSLQAISASDIRKVYEQHATRSPRQAAYAMQVLRAVLRWHGIVVPGNPLGRDTAGRDRIVLPTTRGNPSPIPPERLGAWWRAACASKMIIAADYYRFQLLTGCRGIEIHGHVKHGYAPIRVGDFDAVTASILLRDTKNRNDHRLLLSGQAADIVLRRAQGRAAGEPLFAIVDARKTLASINAAAGTTVQGHALRATFASVAEPLVTASVLKRMLNHAVAGDVTLNHYVTHSQVQLRAGWQAVADFIEREASNGNRSAGADRTSGVAAQAGR